MLRPDSLDDKTTREWLSLTDEVLSSRAEAASAGVNEALLAAFEREPQSPAAPAYRLWAADNLARDGRLTEAVAAYDAAVECAQSAPRLLKAHDPAVGALFHKAQAAAQTGATSTAIATFRELASLTSDDPAPLFHAGRTADDAGDDTQAAELYRDAAGTSPSRRTDDPAELARRALLRLETPPAELAPTAERAAELLTAALERRDGRRLRRLMSRTHFAAGPIGGHTAFETEDLLDALCADLLLHSIEVGPKLLGVGDKRYLPTRGWIGTWFRGEVTFMITRAPRGWQCTGVAIAAVDELWLDRWRPTVAQENQALPFPLLAPWPVDLRFMAGGLVPYVGQQAILVGIAVAGGWPLGPFAAAAQAVIFASKPCGFGARGFYYNEGPTHDADDAFAIDFTRYRQFVPYDNESGGTPVLAARGGIVSEVYEGFPSGYADGLNVVHIEHADPANPTNLRRFTTRYLHLEGPWGVPVSAMMPVVAGTRLGRMDDTGNSILDHLHFSIHDRNIPAPSGIHYGASVRPTPMNGTRLEDEDSGTCVRSTNIEYPGDKPMIEPSSFAGQNWLITPAASAVGATAPSQIEDQTWLLVLSGVAIVDLKGVTASEWRRETVLLRPELTGPLRYAINRYQIPTPPGDEGLTFTAELQVEQWAPFAALSSMLNQHESINSGFAVDLWRPNPFATKHDAVSGAQLDKLFNGIQVDVAVRDSDAWIHRVSYHITLLGKIVFTPIVIT
jgi:tetratricopeptide (TPR) repeat protein